jgi:hypothetical protein
MNNNITNQQYAPTAPKKPFMQGFLEIEDASQLYAQLRGNPKGHIQAFRQAIAKLEAKPVKDFIKGFDIASFDYADMVKVGNKWYYREIWLRRFAEEDARKKQPPYNTI